jgi:hypothetical protein
MDLSILSKEYSTSRKRSKSAPFKTEFGVVRVDPFTKPITRPRKSEDGNDLKRKSFGGDDDSKKLKL